MKGAGARQIFLGMVIHTLIINKTMALLLVNKYMKEEDHGRVFHIQLIYYICITAILQGTETQSSIHRALHYFLTQLAGAISLCWQKRVPNMP